MLYSYLAKTSTLKVLLGALIPIMLLFAYVKFQWDLTLIGAISVPVDVRAAISEMTAEQKIAHAWLTGTVDVAFAFVLGGLFAGIILRGFERFGKYLALLPLASIPFELFEGVIQVLALIDAYDFLDLKSIITPVKTTLLKASFILSLLVGIKYLITRFYGGTT